MICRACGREERASEGYECQRCRTFICVLCNLRGVVLCRACAKAETPAPVEVCDHLLDEHDPVTRSVALDGGWRVYSSGPGIALALIVGQFLGLRREHDRLLLDPVLAPGLDGLRVRLPLQHVRLDIEYRLGPLGHGPLKLQLDGQDLPFVRAANPYRVGAAVVSMAELLPRLQSGSHAGAHALVVHTG